MAKSKKNRQADFQKVKLKVGKKLKKADNVTKTSFQTRKIQVTQKLKAGQASGTPSTKKKQNIAELFTQCRHYSASVRQEAIMGIKDLTTAYPYLVQSHLADIIEKTAELLTDKDPKVRQGATRLLKTTLPQIPEKLISPFFPLLCAHLCCAMTHIVDEIQVESLTVLDVLLEQYPKLIISVSNQVLSNFIEQISRQQGQGDNKRSLSTNPNSTVSTQKHRKSVFNRLHKFLMAMLHSEADPSQVDQDLPELTVDVTLTSAKMAQLFPTYIKSHWDTPGFILGSDIRDQGSASSGQVGARIRDFAATLLPLLLECWVEAAPTHNFSPERGTQVQQENAAAMYSVLQVTQVLLETLDTCSLQEESEGWARVKYMKECNKHFMANFPYEVYIPPYVKGEKRDKQEHVSADSINLAICEIMSRFLPRSATPSGDAPQPPWVYHISSFLTEYLHGSFNRGTVGRNDKAVDKIVKRLIQSRINNDSLAEIIEAIFQRFKGGGNRIAQEKQTYLRFFASIMFEGEASSIVSGETQNAFLKLLPRLLIQAVCENSSAVPLIISVIHQAACRRCLFFSHKEMPMVQQWFDPKSGVILRLDSRERLKLVSVLYCLSDVSIQFRRTLAMLIRHEDMTEVEAAYLLQCLQNRYLQSGETVDHATPHVTLLYQLIMGLTKKEILDIVVSGAKHTSTNMIGGYRIIPVEVGEEKLSWRRHAHLVQLTVDMVHQSKNPADIASILLKVIENYLKENQLIPLQVAFGVCHFARLMHTSCAASLLSGLCVAVLVFTYFPAHTGGLGGGATQPRGGATQPGGGATQLGGGASKDEEMLELLQETVCSLVKELPGGMAVLTDHVQMKASGASAEMLTTLVKCVMRMLSSATAGSQYQTRDQFVAMLTAFKDRQPSLQQTSQETVTTETSRLLAELEYRLSTPPWT